jgi:hypothetical protein
MPLPYTISSSPKTTPISAKGLNDNFNYLDTAYAAGIDVPPPPPNSSSVFVLASRGGFLFWMQTEEC